MAKEKRQRGSVWKKGAKLAHGYYVRNRMSGPRRFRLKEINYGKLKHDMDSPSAAKALGWKIVKSLR